jgi:uncharacterized protein
MTPEADLLRPVIGFAHTLRAAGVAASPDRVHGFVAALNILDPTRRDDVYWAGRLTLCGNHDELARYDRVFAAYFGGETPPPLMRAEVSRPLTMQETSVSTAGEGREGDDERDETHTLVGAASRTEILRTRDFAALNELERAEIDRLLAALRLPGELRRTRRSERAHRGGIDRSDTVRELLRSGGEPVRLRYHRRRKRPRRVVLLLDVSGSMEPYAGALLRFAHATSLHGRARTEIFTIGTRLTRVTREMAHRDPDAALGAVSTAVPDFSGGTRLGELVKAFCDLWGQRGLARGAVVVILSDGWERGDPTTLGEQMARLSRLAHRVVWSNPRKGRPGYAPLAGGMAAALPHVDDFLEGHSLAALERLAAVVAGAARGQGENRA